MINKFFERLTRENWGFPWHVIIAQNATIILMAIIYFIVPVAGFLIPAILSAIVVNIIGVWHEIVQLKSRTSDQKDSIQDIIANNCGIAFSLFVVWLLSRAIIN